MSPSEDNDVSLFEDDDVSEGVDISVRSKEEQDVAEATSPQDSIAQHESMAVRLVRILVVFLLISVTACVAIGVFFYVSNSETSSFEDDFRDSSDKAFDSIGSVFDQCLGANDDLMGSAVSHQKYSNTTWPFVTIPDFAVKAQKILTLSRASIIAVYPKVMHEDRAAWEQYGFENQGWVDESLVIQKSNPFFKGTNLDSYYDYPHIHTNDGISPNNSMYFPTWQASPIVPRWGGK